MASHALARVAPLVLCFLFAACTKPVRAPTKGQIVKQSLPAIDALGAKLTQAADLIEKHAILPAGSACKAPRKLTFDPTSDGHDTDYLTFAAAKEGGRGGTAFDMAFETPFADTLDRLSSKSQTRGLAALDDAPADAAFQDKIRRALGVKDVVIVRELDPSKLLVSGGAALEYYLVDVAGPTIVCGGSFAAHADPSLSSEAKNGTWVTTQRATGKVVKVENKVGDSEYHAALVEDEKKVLAARMKSDLGLDPPGFVSTLR
jgi:hypothetical protein